MYPFRVTSAPHNPARVDELWDPERVRRQLETIRWIVSECRGVTLSGGLAWHFMSPPGHPELKHAHDHKDADLFVEPEHAKGLIQSLKDEGFKRARTKYDNPSGTFVRYVEHYEGGKNVLDIYVERVPFIDVEQDDRVYQVVEPTHLLGLYESTHSSKFCTAVVATKKLLAQGISPVGRPELIGA